MQQPPPLPFSCGFRRAFPPSFSCGFRWALPLLFSCGFRQALPLPFSCELRQALPLLFSCGFRQALPPPFSCGFRQALPLPLSCGFRFPSSVQKHVPVNPACQAQNSSLPVCLLWTAPAEVFLWRLSLPGLYPAIPSLLVSFPPGPAFHPRVCPEHFSAEPLPGLCCLSPLSTLYDLCRKINIVLSLIFGNFSLPVLPAVVSIFTESALKCKILL